MRTDSGTYNVPHWIDVKVVRRLVKAKQHKVVYIPTQPDEGYFVFGGRMVYYNHGGMWVT